MKIEVIVVPVVDPHRYPTKGLHMRLPLLPPSVLDDEQKALYDDIVNVVADNFGDLVVQRDDGALIGPFNAWLHFPTFGRAAWAFNKAMYEHTVLPPTVHQLVILATAARYGGRYEIYGHEYFGQRAGISPSYSWTEKRSHTA